MQKKYKKQFLNTGLNVSKKVVHKAGEYLGNKTADAETKSNDNNNLLEYSQNYSTTSRRLLGYYRDEIDDVDGNALDGKSFEYEAKIVRNAPERPGNEGDANPSPVPTLNVEVTIPLKYLDNFWRSLVLSLINCEIELDLSWKKERVMIEQNNNITGKNFVIISTNLYVLVVTLSFNDNIKFLENIKQGFNRTIS